MFCQQSPIVLLTPIWYLWIFFLCILSAAGQGLTKVSQLLQQFLQCQLLSVAIKKNFALHSCNDIFYFSQTQQNSQDFECHPEVCIVLCCTVRKYIVNVRIIILMHNAFFKMLFLWCQQKTSLNYEYYLWHKLFNNAWEI